jgi:hypothetical protein
VRAFAETTSLCSAAPTRAAVPAFALRSRRAELLPAAETRLATHPDGLGATFAVRGSLPAPLQRPAARAPAACAVLRLPAPPVPAGAACALRSACEWQARATRGADACFCCACAGGATTATALRGDAPLPALR